MLFLIACSLLGIGIIGEAEAEIAIDPRGPSDQVLNKTMD